MMMEIYRESIERQASDTVEEISEGEVEDKDWGVSWWMITESVESVVSSPGYGEKSQEITKKPNNSDNDASFDN